MSYITSHKILWSQYLGNAKKKNFEEFIVFGYSCLLLFFVTEKDCPKIKWREQTILSTHSQQWNDWYWLF